VLCGASDLETCESILRPLVLDSQIVGEVLLSEKDVDLLANLIADLFTTDPENALTLLEHRYPAAFLCFMVWKGKISYREGTFWPPILEALGMSGVQWERQLGQTFLTCLQNMGLRVPEFPDSLIYVTPILFHGGVPDACVGSFFQHVVTPFLDSPFLQEDSLNIDLIKHELEMLANDDAMYREAVAEEKKIQAQLENCKQRIGILQDYLRLQDDLEIMMEEREEYRLPPGIVDFLEEEQRRRALGDIDECLQDLMDLRVQAQKEVLEFTPLEKEIVDSAEQIERLAYLYSRLDKLERCYRVQIGLISAMDSWETSAVEHITGIQGVTDIGQLNLDVSIEGLRSKISERDQIIDELIDHGWIRKDSSEKDHSLELLPPATSPFSKTVTTVASAMALLGLLLILMPEVWKSLVPFLPFNTWILSIFSGAALVVALVCGTRVAKDSKNMKEFSQVIGNLAATLEAIDKYLQCIAGTKTVSPNELYDDSAGYNDSSSEKQRALAPLERLLHLTKPMSITYEDLDSLERLVKLVHQGKELKATTTRLESQIQSISREIWEIQEHCKVLETVLDSAEPCLGKRLRQAQTCQLRSEVARQQLESCIDPKILTLLRVKLYLLLDSVKAQKIITELGQGCFQHGLQVLMRHQDLESRIEVASKEFTDCRRRLDDLDPRLILEPQRYLNEYQDFYTKKQSELEQVKERNSRYRPAFGSAVEEPVTRYILSGGESAFRFLLEAISLVSSNGKASGISGSTSAEKLARRAYELWTSTLGEEARRVSSTYAVGETAPQLIFKDIESRLYIRIPEQRLPLESHRGAVIKVQYGGEIDATKYFNLTVYPENEGWCKTSYMEIPVSFPSGTVELSIVGKTGSGLEENLSETHSLECEDLMSQGSDVIRSWVMEIPSAWVPVSFFQEVSGAEIKGDLPRKHVWLVLAPSWQVLSDLRKIVSLSLTGEWSGYQAWLVDLSEVEQDDIVFVSTQGAEKTFRIQRRQFVEPYLDGKVAPVFLNGAPVYIGDVPSLVLNSAMIYDLSNWRMYITRVSTENEEDDEDRSSGEGETFFIELGSLYEAQNGVNTVKWSENREASVSRDRRGNEFGQDLGPATLRLDMPQVSRKGAIDSYVVRLRGPGQRRYVFVFSVIEDIDICFEPYVVGPYDTEPFNVHVDMIFPEEVRFEAVTGVENCLIEPGYASFELRSDQKSIEGTLRVGETAITYSIRIPVPLVWCAIEGGGKTYSTWDTMALIQMDIDELRSMDYPELSVFLFGCDWLEVDLVELRLEGTNQCVGQPVEKGKAVFKLPQFYDTLTQLTHPAIFSLALYSGPEMISTPVSLARVFTRWTVENVVAHSSIEDGNLAVKLTWTQTGLPKNPRLRLWPGYKFWAPPSEVEIESSEPAASVLLDPTSHRPGPFFLHFVEVSPWESSREICEVPKTQDLNLFAIEIIPDKWSPGGFRVDWQKRMIRAVPEFSENASLTGSCLQIKGREILMMPVGLPIGGDSYVPLPNTDAGEILALAIYDENAGFVELNPFLPKVTLPLEKDMFYALLNYWDPMEFKLGLVECWEGVNSQSDRNFGQAGTSSTAKRTVYWAEGPEALSLIKSAIANKPTEIRVSFGGDQRLLPVELSIDGVGVVKVEKAVRCMSCGRSFPDEHAWDRHLYECEAGAKVLDLKRTEIQVRAFVEWNPISDIVRFPKQREELVKKKPVDLSAEAQVVTEAVRDWIIHKELLTVARWCTEKSGEKWVSLLKSGSAEDLAKEIFRAEIERRKCVKCR